jgi:hypothetical protein
MKWGRGWRARKYVIIPDDDVFGTRQRAQSSARGGSLWLIRSSTTRRGGGEEVIRCQDVPTVDTYPDIRSMMLKRTQLVVNCVLNDDELFGNTRAFLDNK